MAVSGAEAVFPDRRDPAEGQEGWSGGRSTRLRGCCSEDGLLSCGAGASSNWMSGEPGAGQNFWAAFSGLAEAGGKWTPDGANYIEVL